MHTNQVIAKQRPRGHSAFQSTVASLALFASAMLTGCASDDPTWKALQGDWSVFTGAPAWIEREFERSGEELKNDGRWIAKNFSRNVQKTAELPSDIKVWAEDDFRKSGEGLAYQSRVIGREIGRNVESFEQDILGAPAWVGREFDNSGRELAVDFRWIGNKVEQQANEFWPEFKRYIRVMMR